WATKVKEMTQRILALPEQIEKVIETNFESDQKRNQFVYLIGSNDYVKIGIATNVKKRFSSLQTASPVPLKLLKSWRCANAWTKELKLHRRYARFRQNGEWFRLSDRVLNRLL